MSIDYLTHAFLLLKRACAEADIAWGHFPEHEWEGMALWRRISGLDKDKSDDRCEADLVKEWEEFMDVIKREGSTTPEGTR